MNFGHSQQESAMPVLCPTRLPSGLFVLGERVMVMSEIVKTRTVRMTSDEDARVRELARRESRSVSNMLRQLVKRALASETLNRG